MDLDSELFDSTRGFRHLRVENPLQLAAEAWAKELVAQASLNEAIDVIMALEAEVADMPIASRFRTDVYPSESVYAAGMAMNPSLKNLNESEHKRQALLLALGVLKMDVLLAVSRLEIIVMDIEATKAEF